MITLLVHYDGRQLTLRVSYYIKAAEAARIAAELLGVDPADGVRLLSDGAELNPNATLRQCGVRNGEALCLEQSPRNQE